MKGHEGLKGFGRLCGLIYSSWRSQRWHLPCRSPAADLPRTGKPLAPSSCSFFCWLPAGEGELLSLFVFNHFSWEGLVCVQLTTLGTVIAERVRRCLLLQVTPQARRLVGHVVAFQLCVLHVLHARFQISCGIFCFLTNLYLLTRGHAY